MMSKPILLSVDGARALGRRCRVLVEKSSVNSIVKILADHNTNTTLTTEGA